MRTPTVVRLQPAAAAAAAAAGRRAPSRAAQRRNSCIVTASARRGAADSLALSEAYDLLEVSPACSDDELKAAYRRLQKAAHPDSANGDAGLSARLNAAYELLTAPGARRSYVFSPRRGAAAAAQRAVSRAGLVGPLRDEVLADHVSSDATPFARDLLPHELLDGVREWAATLAFTTELPLPYPLQVDQVPDGVRLAMVTVDGGVVAPLGELIIHVTAAAPDAPTHVSVTRRWTDAGRSGPLPGEERVLKLLEREFIDLGSSGAGNGAAAQPLQVSGLWSAMLSMALPAIPPLPLPGALGARRAGGHRGYWLARSCRLPDAPPPADADAQQQQSRAR